MIIETILITSLFWLVVVFYIGIKYLAALQEKDQKDTSIDAFIESLIREE